MHCCALRGSEFDKELDEFYWGVLLFLLSLAKVSGSTSKPCGIFFKKTQQQKGYGTKTRFWYETWHGNSPLTDFFPNLYSFTTFKTAVLFNYRGDIAGLSTFRRNQNDWELDRNLSWLDSFRNSPPASSMSDCLTQVSSKGNWIGTYVDWIAHYYDLQWSLLDITIPTSPFVGVLITKVTPYRSSYRGFYFLLRCLGPVQLLILFT